MRGTRKLIVVALAILMIVMVCSVSFAVTASYYPNGNPSIIKNEKGTINYYENGNVSSVITDNGTAYYNEDGTIKSIVGTPSISLDEAKAEFQALKKQSTPTQQNTQTPQTTEAMPETGFENYIYIFAAIAVVGAIFFGVRYNSLKKF